MARKTSGNSCGRTGSPIGCSNHSMISSITAAMPGTLSSISPGRSCPSRAAIGQTWVIQCEDWYKNANIAMATFLKIFIVVLLVVLFAHAFVGWLRPDTPRLSFLPGDITYESPGGNVRVYFPIVT